MTQAMQIAADAWSLGELLDFAYPQAKGTRPDDLAERSTAHHPPHGPAAPVVREVVADVGDRGSTQHAAGHSGEDPHPEERPVAVDQPVRREGDGHHAAPRQ